MSVQTTQQVEVNAVPSQVLDTLTHTSRFNPIVNGKYAFMRTGQFMQIVRKQDGKVVALVEVAK